MARATATRCCSRLDSWEGAKPPRAHQRERLARVEWMFGYLGDRRRRVCRVRVHVLFIAVCCESFLRRHALPPDLCNPQVRTAFDRGEIPGVVAVEPRIVRDVLVDWRASNLPVSARIVSITRARDENLALLYLRSGVAAAPHDARDVAINEAFAEANAVRPGADVIVYPSDRIVAGASVIAW